VVVGCEFVYLYIMCVCVYVHVQKNPGHFGGSNRDFAGGFEKSRDLIKTECLSVRRGTVYIHTTRYCVHIQQGIVYIHTARYCVYIQYVKRDVFVPNHCSWAMYCVYSP
jgi:hypothetical protein